MSELLEGLRSVIRHGPRSCARRERARPPRRARSRAGATTVPPGDRRPTRRHRDARHPPVAALQPVSGSVQQRLSAGIRRCHHLLMRSRPRARSRACVHSSSDAPIPWPSCSGATTATSPAAAPRRSRDPSVAELGDDGIDLQVKPTRVPLLAQILEREIGPPRSAMSRATITSRMAAASAGTGGRSRIPGLN